MVLVDEIVWSVEDEKEKELKNREDKYEGKGDINMLESNTDRSYFMIGAVILAGIIIAGAVFIFRDLIFTSDGFLADTFAEMNTKANEMIGNIDTSQAQTITGLGSQLKLVFDMMFI